MTKQVHTRDMVAHLWAHKSQDSARNAGGNFYFTGATLFSYGSHFVCAHHMPDAYNRDGRALALFNAGRYSMTTGRHMDTAWRALPGSIVRVDVPGLDSNMVRDVDRWGCRDVVAALLASMRRIADKAANPRIRPDTRGALFSELRDLRADALHLATVDASRRDLSAERRKAARAQVAELSAADVDAFATEGNADKAGAAAYAFALNRAQWLDKMRETAASAQRYAARAIGECDAGNVGGALDCAQQAERYAAGAKELADKAGAKLPRAVVRELAAIKAGTKWRADVEARVRVHAVESARNEWAEGEAIARDAMAERDFYTVNRQLTGDMRRAFETLHGEPGDSERRAFVAQLTAAVTEWQAKGDAEQAREQIAAARELFAAGKFTAASDAARSARHKMLRANGAPGCVFPMEETEGAEALAQAADARKPEEYAAQLVDWRNAKPGARFPSQLHNTNRAAFLRLSPDGRRVETSQGAEVPVRVCSLVWHLLGEQRAAGTARSFAPGSVKLGNFALDSIDAEGNVRAGCHFIPYSELADIAGRLAFNPHN
ncbi:MAG: hypothetical protein ACREO4_09215 [Lysobacter sp.]